MKKKEYWCDFGKKPGFIWFLAIAGMISLVIFVLINSIVTRAYEKKTSQEIKAAETYYDTYYSIKYTQLTDVINHEVLQNQTLQLGILGTAKYHIDKDENDVVFVCEFPAETNDEQAPYIISTTLSSNLQVLSQETNQLEKEDFIDQHLTKTIRNQKNATQLTVFFLYYILLFAILIVSVKVSEKHKQEDLKALSSENLSE